MWFLSSISPLMNRVIQRAHVSSGQWTKPDWLTQPSQSSSGTNTFKWIRNVSIIQYKVHVREEPNLVWWTGPMASYRHGSPSWRKREVMSTHVASSRFLTPCDLTLELETSTSHQRSEKLPNSSNHCWVIQTLRQHNPNWHLRNNYLLESRELLGHLNYHPDDPPSPLPCLMLT